MTWRTWWCSAPTSRSFSQGLDCELGVNYDETEPELALYLALEMETDVIPFKLDWTDICTDNYLQSEKV